MPRQCFWCDRPLHLELAPYRPDLTLVDDLGLGICTFEDVQAGILPHFPRLTERDIFDSIIAAEDAS